MCHSLYLELGFLTWILLALTFFKSWLKCCYLRELFSDHRISFCFLNFLPSFIFLHSTHCLLKPYVGAGIFIYLVI